MEGKVSNPGKRDVSVEYDDPFEAIFALNVGDFVAEDFLSKDLLEKISSKINASPEEKYQRLKNQLSELISIYSIGNTLNLLGFEGEEGFVVYDSIAVTIANMLDMHCCNIFLKPDILPLLKKDINKQLILFGTSHSEKNREYGYSFGDQSILTKSYRTGEKVLIKNIKMDPYWRPSDHLDEKKMVTFLSVPMLSGQNSIGLINLYSYEEKEIPQELIELIESIAAIFAVSIRLQDLMDEATELLEDQEASTNDMTRVRAHLTGSIGDLGVAQQLFVEALAAAVDAKSSYTREHSRNVANMAREISLEMNLNEKTIDLIYYAGLLQNIGKIMIPNELFSKKESLTDADWKKLQDHPNIGVDLLMKVNFLSEVVPYINYYRERWDGKGQPEGLEGMSIPLGSRIIAVADAYQAMVSDRAYRDSMTEDQALRVMKEEAGTKWDPVVVDALISRISRN
jgi:HD-GYP domain-containing protein (c-di-GMP phosphodiesterase class II)